MYWFCATIVTSPSIMRHHLNQAYVIMHTAWQRNLNYRFTVLAYRVGEIAEILVLILMWTAIYEGGGGIIKGFTLNEMITYVLIGNLVAVAVRNFLPAYVSRDINEGRLSMFLVKPIPYIQFIFFNELGRAFLATVISLASQVAVTYFFLDKVVVNHDLRYLGVIMTMVFLAFIIEWLIGFLIGTIAFWTDEVDGIQSTIERIKRFFAGGYFPLTLLPAALVTTSTYLPFQYSFFAPAALYLQKMTLAEGVHGLFVQVVWIILFSLLLYVVWARGLRRYEAVGS
jgi:ABC-2 type transport system permease protein